MEKLFELSQNFLGLENKVYVRDFIKEDPFKKGMSFLLGQRGVGKTTSLIQYMLSQYGDIRSKKMLYVPVDHILVEGETLYGIAEEFNKLGGELLCLDEIHKYDAWSKELKSIYDTFPALRVIASGSSALEVNKGSHDLSRRAIKYTLYGLSFREYLGISHGIELSSFSLDDLLQDHQNCARGIINVVEKLGNKILPLFKKYLEHGYYPFYLRLEDRQRFMIALEQNVHAAIESDLLAIYPSLSGNSIKKIKRLLAFIAQKTPYEADYSKMRRATEIPDDRTLKSYLKYLEDAQIIKGLSAEGKSMNTFDKVDKIFLNNTNLIYALGGETVQVGTVRETFFLSALSAKKEVSYPKVGDFKVAKNLFEIGGKNKRFDQIKDINDSFLVVDDVEIGIGNKIPLWLFGFLE